MCSSRFFQAVRLFYVFWALFFFAARPAWAQTNLALGKPITASGTLISGYPVTNVVDGNAATFTHPNAASGNAGFYYQIDLGATYTLSRIVLRNRANCCPERLSNDSVRVFADGGGGVVGAQNWAATLRADGTNSGMGGVDTMTGSADPAGTFMGRYIRVVNLNGAGYNPQIAEVEVYGISGPLISSFSVDDDTLTAGQSAVLSWNVTGATTLTLNPGNIALSGATGTLVISPAATTTYTLTAVNAGGTTNAMVNVGVDVVLAPPLINEFLAENDGGLKDEDDQSSDWIELKNPNPYRLEVGGYFLSTKPASLTQWMLPAGTVIPQNGYLVVFASGKNRVTSPLHANFKLSNAGEFLALTAPDGTTILQQFPSNYPAALKYPKQFSNISYTSSGSLGYMKPPTPGAANGPVSVEVAADPVFSAGRGFYEAAQSLSLSSPTSGATIRYTLDGSLPSPTSGTVFSAAAPISVAGPNGATLVRAVAYKAGAITSDVETHTYLFLNNVINNAVFAWANAGNPTSAEKLESLRDVPSVSIVTPNAISPTATVAASIEWLRPDGAPGFQENCGVEFYGNSVGSFAKKSTRVVFKGEFGATKLQYPVFEGFDHGLRPATSFDTLDFRSGSHDMRQRGFYMANAFTDDTMLETGTVYPHGRYVHVYMNGLYNGMYHLREHWDANTAYRYLGGAAANYETINGNANIGTAWDVGSVADGDGSAWTRIKSLRSNLSALKPYLDITEYIDWQLMWMFGRCEGEYRISGPSGAGSGFKIFLNDGDGYLKPADSLWDGWGDRTVFTAAGLSPAHSSGDGPGDVFSGLFNANNADYRVLLADRIYKAYFNNGLLTPARNDARLRARCLQAEKALKAECARWYSNSATNFRTYASWQAARDSVLSTWMPPNTASVLNELRNRGFYPPLAANREAPSLNLQGGKVAPGFVPAFTGPAAPAAASIYYTLDGSDPQLPGGAVSATARLFVMGSGAALPALTQSALFKSRHKNGNDWSALNEAFFYIGVPIAPGEVVVSELHFNPTGGEAQEFLELRNVSSRPVNLRGASFTAGIAFTFSEYADTLLAPGQRLLLVKDLFAFRALYGTEIPVAGVYDGSLENGGETVTFRASAAADAMMLETFTYDGANPWPLGADGAGYSLTRTLPATLDPNLAAAWRTSTALGGSPGSGDGLPAPAAPMEDADGDGLPALIEYALGTNPADPASGMTGLVAGRDPSGRVTLSFPHHVLAEEAVCAAETSADLVTWSPAEFVSRTGTGARATETWRSWVPASTALFIRLRVTQLP